MQERCDRPMGALMNKLDREDLDPIVELQALELSRLMRENKRLNQRIDFLIDEITWLRRVQERELSLRESEHAMFREGQETVRLLIDDARERQETRPAPPQPREQVRLAEPRRDEVVRAGLRVERLEQTNDGGRPDRADHSAAPVRDSLPRDSLPRDGLPSPEREATKQPDIPAFLTTEEATRVERRRKHVAVEAEQTGHDEARGAKRFALWGSR